MKTLQITGVRFIPTDAKGNTLNLFIIDLANGQPSIVRSAKEFMIDLTNSYLIGAHVRNPAHPELLGVLRDLKGATISGDILTAKKGELWTVTATSSAVTKPSHPMFGKVSAGDQLPYEKDMTLVNDGFLTVTLHPQVTMMNKQAQAYGMSLASMLNAFDMPSNEPAVTATGAEPVVAPDDVMGAAIGDTPDTTDEAKDDLSDIPDTGDVKDATEPATEPATAKQ